MEKRMNNFGEKLDLTADQKAKIAAIRKNSIAESQKLKEDSKMEKSKKGEAFKKIHSNQQAEIAQVLNPEQNLKMESIKKERRENNKNKRDKNGKYKGKKKFGKNKYSNNKQKNKLVPAKE